MNLQMQEVHNPQKLRRVISANKLKPVRLKKRQMESQPTSPEDNQDEKLLKNMFSKAILHLKNYKVDDALKIFTQCSYINLLGATCAGAEFSQKYFQVIKVTCDYATSIQSKNAELALTLFQWAEDLLEKEDLPAAKCMVYNGLGCLYRRTGKLQHSLSILEKANELVRIHDLPNKSITYTNVTAILAQMGLYQQSVEFAKKALKECQEELELMMNDPQHVQDKQQYPDKQRQVTIAYYNLAAGEEQLGNIEESHQIYHKSYRYSLKYFGEEDQLTQRCKKGWIKTKAKIDELMRKSNQKIKIQLRPSSATLKKNNSQQSITINKGPSRRISEFEQLTSTNNNSAAPTFYYRGLKRGSQDPSSDSSALIKTQSNFILKTVKTPVVFQNDALQQEEEKQQQENNKLKELERLKKMGALDWSESDDNSDKLEESIVEQPKLSKIQSQINFQPKEIPKNTVTINSPQSTNSQINEYQQKESRMLFLNKMTLFETEDTLKKKYILMLEQEKLKQLEAERQLSQLSEQQQEEQRKLNDLKKMIRVQSYIKMKIQRRLYLKQLEELKRLRKQQFYISQVIKIQRWMRKYVFRERMLKATRETIKNHKCKKYVGREIISCIKIQKMMRKYLSKVRIEDQIRILKSKQFLCLRTSQFEPRFVDGENRPFVHHTLANRQFWFRLWISKPHNELKILIIPYQKRKCMKSLQQGFSKKILLGDLYLMFALYTQYIEWQKSLIDEDPFITRTLENINDLNKNIVKKVLKNDDQYGYKLEKQTEQFMENHIRKLGPQLERLCCIKENNKLILLGYDDFRYDTLKRFKNDLEKQLVAIKPINPTKTQINLVIWIQGHIRGILWRVRSNLIKQKITTTTKNFTVRQINHLGKAEYVRVFINTEKSSKKLSIFCRIESSKKKTNSIPLYEAITKQLGYPTSESFHEVYQIKFETNTLELTDEGKYWLAKDKERPGALDVVKLQRRRIQAALKIQQMFRNHDARMQYQLLVSRDQQKQQHGHRRHQPSHVTQNSLVRKVVIHGEAGSKRAYYMNFILTTSLENEEKIQNRRLLHFMINPKQQEHKEKQKIAIHVKTLEHFHSREIVKPFTQPLFYYVDPAEILSIAQIMLDIAVVKKSRKSNTQKLKVKNLEEVQGMVVNKNRKIFEGHIDSKKEETLEARKIFNTNTQRFKYLFKNQNVFEYAQDRHPVIHRDNIEELTKRSTNSYQFRKIIKAMAAFRIKIHSSHSDEKEVIPYDAHSISRYVQEFENVTDLCLGEDQDAGYENIHFLRILQNRKDHQEQIIREQVEKEIREMEDKMEEVRIKEMNIAKSQEHIFNDYCVIDSERVTLTIIYNKLLGQLKLKVIKDDENFQMVPDAATPVQEELVILKDSLLPSAYVNENFMKAHIEQLIIKQLALDDGLYFKPDPNMALFLIQEQIHWEQQQEQFQANQLKQQTETTAEKVQRMIMSPELLSRTAQQALKDMKKQIVHIATLEREQWEHEYIYDITDDFFILTIYLVGEIKTRSLHIVQQSEFQCNYIKRSIHLKTPEEIIRFMMPTVKAFERLIEVSLMQQENKRQIVVTNFEDFRPHIPQIFKEQFMIRIQNRLLVRQSIGYVLNYKNRKKTEIFIKKVIQNYEGRYLEFLFYLSRAQYTLRFHMRELNQVDGNGNILTPKRISPQSQEYYDENIILNKMTFQINLIAMQDRQIMEQIFESLNDYQKQCFARANPHKWVQLEQPHKVHYYQKLFRPLVDIIMDGIHVKYVSTTQIRIGFDGLPIPITKLEQSKPEEYKDEINFFALINAVMRLQNGFKRLKLREWFKLKYERKQQLEVKERQIGKFVRRSFRQIQNINYIVSIYQRSEGTFEQQILTFDLIPYTDKKIERRDIKQRLRGQYLWDPTQMLNIGSLSLFDYLIEQIFIEKHQLKFKNANFLNANKIQGLAVNPKDNPVVKRALTRAGTLAFISEDIQSQGFIDQLQGPEKLVNHTHLENGVFNDVPETIYNVIYSGRNIIQAQKADAKNLVTIEINLDNVRKLYPTLNTKDNDVMKVIGEQLIEGIKVSKDGELLIDQRKINPTFITLRRSTIEPPNEQLDDQVQQVQKRTINIAQIRRQISSIGQVPPQTSKHQVMLKKSVYYQSHKYLICIIYLERKIAKIIKQSVDQVFEEFEIIYQIVASDLTQKKKDPLIWELSPEQASILSHAQEKFDIAHNLLKRVLVISDHFLFLTESKADQQLIKTPFKNVILFLEKGIRPIQRRFRDRALFHNYKSYKNFLQQYKDTSRKFLPLVIQHSLDSLKSSHQFITLVVDDKNKRIRFFAWNIQNYHSYDIDIPKGMVFVLFIFKYQEILSQDRKLAILTLSQFVEFSPDIDGLIFSPLAMEIVKLQFNKNLTKLQNQENYSQAGKSNHQSKNKKEK